MKCGHCEYLFQYNIHFWKICQNMFWGQDRWKFLRTGPACFVIPLANLLSKVDNFLFKYFIRQIKVPYINNINASYSFSHSFIINYYFILKTICLFYWNMSIRSVYCEEITWTRYLTYLASSIYSHLYLALSFVK